MERLVLLLFWTAAFLLVWLTVPNAALAHEGKGFHPEALWALLRTGVFVALALFSLGGTLWAYDWAKSRKAK